MYKADDEQAEGQPRNTGHHLHSAHSLFPSCLCSAVVQIISLLDDAAVSADGNAVYEVAYQVGVWQNISAEFRHVNKIIFNT